MAAFEQLACERLDRLPVLRRDHLNNAVGGRWLASIGRACRESDGRYDKGGRGACSVPSAAVHSVLLHGLPMGARHRAAGLLLPYIAGTAFTSPGSTGDERVGRILGRPIARQPRLLRWIVACGLTTVLLSACGAPSSRAPTDDFAAPPVEPISVQGLDGCARLEHEGSTGDDSDRLPQVELPCLNESREVDVSRLAGPAVVNLWASWCGPCRKEMPMLARAARRHPELQFVGINTLDRQEAAADLLTKTGVTYPQLVDVDAVVLHDTRVPGLPVTLAVDVDGRVVDRVIGELSSSELATLLESLSQGQ